MSRRLDFKGKGPIIFEGIELPLAAKIFEGVSFWDELPPDTRNWLLDLCYCWGRTRRLGSRHIARHLNLIRQRLNEDDANATERLQRRFPEATDADLKEMLIDWRKSLDLIEQCAEKTRVCEWTIAPQDECLEVNLKLAIKMCRDGVAGAPPLVPHLVPGLEFRIRNLGRKEQLKWLESFSDAFSRKQTWWQRLKASVFSASFR